ncbi:hypothetical protein EW145_g6169 [Phellinidium pouzarii]|uniref:Oxidase ustYa n=1 Tax=Phellinidium pouzarii TaxID=167371 RepID=A0A4S4KZA4_9AGAM|nr:hypothetical protein EW145_g6169 [Phellinidium pouzarii]
MLPPSTSRSVALIRICIIALGIFNAYLTFTLQRRPTMSDRQYTYIADDFPAEIDVPGLEEQVSLVTEQTTHYQLNGSEADMEWEMLLPLPARLVRLGPDFRPFAVSMLHTLHCLDRLRHYLYETPTTNVGREHVEHCANYIREDILCGANTRLIPAGGVDGDIGNLNMEYTCRDWTAVYVVIQKNHQAYVDSSGGVSQL